MPLRSLQIYCPPEKGPSTSGFNRSKENGDAREERGETGRSVMSRAVGSSKRSSVIIGNSNGEATRSEYYFILEERAEIKGGILFTRKL